MFYQELRVQILELYLHHLELEEWRNHTHVHQSYSCEFMILTTPLNKAWPWSNSSTAPKKPNTLDRELMVPRL